MATPRDVASLNLPDRIEVDPDLHLRAFVDEDAPALFAAVDRAREILRPILPWADTTRDPADSLAFIRSGAGRLARAVVLDGEIAGCVGVNALDGESGRVEFGYWLEPRAGGRGAITRACRALYAAGGFRELELLIPVGNEPSLGVARRLGLVDTGERIDRNRFTLHRFLGIPT